MVRLLVVYTFMMGGVKPCVACVNLAILKVSSEEQKCLQIPLRGTSGATPRFCKDRSQYLFPSFVQS